LKRNAWERIYYELLHAQSNFERREQNAWQAKHPLKNKDIYEFVTDKLKEGWSPEQISGRLKLELPNDPHWHICQETIYRYIHRPDNRNKHLYEYLSHGKTKETQKENRTVGSSRENT